MVKLKLVEDDKRILLAETYDHSQKFRLWQAFASEHEKFVLRASGHSGRDSFVNYIDKIITEFLYSDGNIIDPSADDGILDTGSITSKTVYNFLSKSLSELERVYNGTFRYVDAFLAVLNKTTGTDYRRPSFLESLGAANAIQFSPNTEDVYRETLEVVGTGDRRLFLFDKSTSMLPAPLQAENVLVWFQHVAGERFFLVRIAPMPRKIENAHARFSKNDKSDWSEDHYTGIAIVTRDGISCHLTSMNAKIPLYVLVKLDPEAILSCAFISYETPGYLLDYASLSPLKNPKALEYFEKIPWIV